MEFYGFSYGIKGFQENAEDVKKKKCRRLNFVSKWFRRGFKVIQLISGSLWLFYEVSQEFQQS